MGKPMGEWACTWLLGLRDLLAAGVYDVAPRLPASMHTEDGAGVMGWVDPRRGVFIRAGMVAVVGLPCSSKALYEELYRTGVSWTQTKARRGAQLFINGRARRVVHLAPWAWQIVTEKISMIYKEDPPVSKLTYEDFEAEAKERRVNNPKVAYLIAVRGGAIDGVKVDWKKLRTDAPELFGGPAKAATVKTSAMNEALRGAIAGKSYTQTAGGGTDADKLASDAIRSMIGKDG